MRLPDPNLIQGLPVKAFEFEGSIVGALDQASTWIKATDGYIDNVVCCYNPMDDRWRVTVYCQPLSAVENEHL